MDTTRSRPTRFGLARVAAAASLVTVLVAGQGHARADSHLVLTLVPRHVLLARGFSLRGGDDFAIEPAVPFVGDGPQDVEDHVSFLKVSAGMMTNVGDRRDRHAQLGIGCGF